MFPSDPAVFGVANAKDASRGRSLSQYTDTCGWFQTLTANSGEGAAATVPSPLLSRNITLPELILLP
jgi:hypothetical protein